MEMVAALAALFPQLATALPCDLATYQARNAHVTIETNGNKEWGCGTGENALHVALLGLSVLALTWLSLALATEHDGTLYILCFSDDGPDTGPHPISQEELRAAFTPTDGMLSPSSRSGFRRDTTRTAHRPGSRE